LKENDTGSTGIQDNGMVGLENSFLITKS